MKTENVSVEKLEVNKGQLYGLPKNPRFIKDERFEALKKSISDAPEMLNLRELLVYPLEGIDKYVIIGGNMRFRACKDLDFKEIPCKILPIETPVAKLREYTIKDNEGFGSNDWDIIANEWDAGELEDWGMECDFLGNEEEEPEEEEPEEEKQPKEAKDLSDEIETQYQVIVVCENEGEQEEIFNKLTDEGLCCKLLTL